ncbi:DUF3054 domain-containing protein [Halobacteriales archaeon Cl-PHB]
MSTATYVRSRIDRTPLTLGLVAGDLLAITLFAAVGVFHHWGTLRLDRLFWAGLPLLVGWVLAAFVGGLYTDDAVATPRRAVSWTLPAWVVAALVGYLLRSTEPIPGSTAFSFLLVTIGFGGLFVVGWRLVVAVTR